MIITKIIGGLGNQMFQYAAARNLSEHYKTVLHLDISAFKEKKFRTWPYQLKIFNLYEEYNTIPERRINDIYGIRLKIAKFRTKTVVENKFSFDENLINSGDNIYLDGYWQSEKYFIGISDIIKKEFSFKLNLDDKNAAILDKINNVNSVSLHVRRGDYISNPSAKLIHGDVCDINYYKRAMNYISEKITSPVYFVFSDDPLWIKNNLSISGEVHYIDWNRKDESWIDMYLMSKCQHNIIANSTFSWWGAWLNKYENKIVVAPRRWFNVDTIDSKDLIPSTWVKI